MFCDRDAGFAGDRTGIRAERSHLTDRDHRRAVD
jgi:hypothetical protein